MRAFANRKVLVLNKNWTAIGVTTLPRAIVMLFSTDTKGTPKAHIVDHSEGNITPYTWEEWSLLRPKDDEAAIHAIRGSFRIPEVIKVSRYDKLPTQKIHFSRRTIYKRDNLTCQYCKKKFKSVDLSIDHVTPRSVGGLTTWTNTILSCTYCNKCKANRVPKQHMAQVGHPPQLVKIYTVFFQDGKKQWQVQVQEPKKPEYNFFGGEIHYKSWSQWVDISYWNVELENDNPD